jgi:hypothetical protein
MCCCRLYRLHMNVSLRYKFLSIIYFSSNTPDRKNKKNSRSIIVYICVSKGIKRKSQQQNVYIFPYFSPDLLKKTEKKAKKKKGKESE